jgi:heme ABC exporter ATP-binding subunit CcmA
MAAAMALSVVFRAAVALTGRFPALAGVDLEVSQGEMVVLEGPNGAGKTSLLRACAGLLPVMSGTAEVLGRNLRNERVAVRRHVGFIGHAPALYDDLTPVENARFAVRAAGCDPRTVDDALERLGVVGRLRRTPAGRLSAGQRRRVELAVLHARQPELWLLDEPHTGLDPEARTTLAAMVGHAIDGGATVLVASHEDVGALPSVQRVVSLAGGRVVGDRRVRAAQRAPLAVAEASVVPGGVHVA